MGIIVYLLNVSKLKEASSEDELFKDVRGLLDAERLEKFDRMRAKGVKAHSGGAGLLIQYFVNKLKQDYNFPRNLEADSGKDFEITELELDEIIGFLKICGAPAECEYVYTPEGKPKLKNIKYEFNLSHSGDYVALAVGKNAVGIDIQELERRLDVNIAEKYFHPCERGITEKKDFYRLWTRKEAYAKLKGESLVTYLDKDMTDKGIEAIKDVIFGEVEMTDDYICTFCYTL